ncbi:MAG TPA: tetratricopeptide repeat protein [Burkholderiales bacterium]|nr:tetratricopeptide repeat protein [Burkholderiales bacterium]
MSLLLEALKRAEKAKEEAQRRARAEPGAEPGGEPEELQGEGETPAEPKPVLTRDRLPDISQPLEILSDDLVDKTPAAPALEPASAAPAREASARPAPSASRAERHVSDPDQAGRASARKVFEAKFREPNPRMPFYITMGVLGAFALGTVGYFWVQLRPPPGLVNANPPRQGADVPVATAQSSPAAMFEPRMSNSQPAIPGLPGAVPASPAQPVQAPPPATLLEQRPQAPRLAPRLAPAPTPEPTEVNVARAAPSVHPKVDAGYSAYLAGDLALARAEYQQVLAEEPGNRDALLGLAALDVRAGRYEAAQAVYQRLLQADPRDAQAQAALIALRGGRVDPLAAESRLKSLLAADPGAHVLNFTLGNQLAQQGRWAEAQQEYFKAFAAEPDNADFAYNLAVSLDHLHQGKLALEYYQRAVMLAKARGARFDLAAAERRAAQLAR